MPTSIKCGHCQQYHGSVAEVKACAGQPTRSTFAEQWKPAAPVANLVARALVSGSNPVATAKQLAFITKLLAEREHGLDIDTSTLTRKAASNLITILMDAPRKKGPAGVGHAVLEDGIYTYEGKHYRVYHTVHGSGQQVASLINTEAAKEARKADKFTYLGKKPLAFLRPEHKMSFEDACRFGSAYEWCCACGTILHNDKSVELGIGPICRGKYFS